MKNNPGNNTHEIWKKKKKKKTDTKKVRASM